MVEKDTDADGNGTVGDIKRRPMIVSQINIQKINHHAKSDSIDQIADGTAKNQRKGSRQPGVLSGCLFVEVKNQTDGQRRNKKENNTSQDRAQICHKPESAPPGCKYG